MGRLTLTAVHLTCGSVIVWQAWALAKVPFWVDINGFYALYYDMMAFKLSAFLCSDTDTYKSWHVWKLFFSRARTTQVYVVTREHVASVAHGAMRGIMGEREEPCVREWKTVECVTPNMDLELENFETATSTDGSQLVRLRSLEARIDWSQPNCTGPGSQNLTRTTNTGKCVSRPIEL